VDVAVPVIPFKVAGSFASDNTAYRSYNERPFDVRFTPKSCRGCCRPARPLSANSDILHCGKVGQIRRVILLCSARHEGSSLMKTRKIKGMADRSS
jgi:hypothetical protein